MLSLTHPLDTEIEVYGKVYQLDLYYDTVLHWYKLMEDKRLNEYGKIQLAFDLFIREDNGEPTEDNIPFEYKLATVQSLAKYISGKSDDTEEDNEQDSGAYEEQKEHFSFTQDADFIFASFMQEYGIDIDEKRGILRWEKFIALLNGLRNDTKFNEIIGVRCAELPTGSDPDSMARSRQLQQLKAMYALDSDKNVKYMDNALDNLFNNLKEF